MSTPNENSPRPTPHLLGIPPETRRIIYTHLLLSPRPLLITPSPPSSPLPITPHPLTSQLLAVHPLLHTEALPLLYAHNTFDITPRSSLLLLTTTIPSTSFAMITHLILDWDSLLDFSFQLAKPSFRDLCASLTILETKHWRNRVCRTESAFLWRDVKAYERSICTASQAILEKAPGLNVLGQREWERRGKGSGVPGKGKVLSRSEEIVRRNRERAEREAVAAAVAAAAAGEVEGSVGSVAGEGGGSGGGEDHAGTGPATQQQPAQPRRGSAATMRVKWRFLASTAQLGADETVVDIDAEVAALTSLSGREEEWGARQMALDPI